MSRRPLLIAALLALSPAPAFACTCMGATPADADVIVEGRVVALERPGLMRMSVSRTLKGVHVDERMVEYEVGNGFNCGTNFSVSDATVRVAASVGAKSRLSTGGCLVSAGRGLDGPVAPPPPSDPADLAVYAKARSDDSDPEAALAAWRALKPTDATGAAAAAEALILLSLKETAEAEAVVEAAKAAMPDSAPLRHARVALLLAAGKAAEIPADHRDFHGLALADLSFAGRDLTGADFTGATLNGVNFAGAVLDGARFRDATINNCDFSQAKLRRADFSRSQPPDYPKDEADFAAWRRLQRSHPAGHRRSSFEGADLTGADLRRAALPQPWLKGADLRDAIADGARLDRANLSGARLSGSRWTGAGLRDADLTGADLSGADLSGVSLDTAKLAGAVSDAATRWPPGHSESEAPPSAWPEAVACLKARTLACVIERLEALMIASPKRLGESNHPAALLFLAGDLLAAGHVEDGRRLVRLVDRQILPPAVNGDDPVGRLRVVKALLARHDKRAGPDLAAALPGCYDDFLIPMLDVAIALGDAEGAAIIARHLLRPGEANAIGSIMDLPFAIAAATGRAAVALGKAGKGRDALDLVARIADNAHAQKIRDLPPAAGPVAADHAAAEAAILARFKDAAPGMPAHVRADRLFASAQPVAAAIDARLAKGDRAAALALLRAYTDAALDALSRLDGYAWPAREKDWGASPQEQTIGGAVQAVQHLSGPLARLGEGGRIAPLAAGIDRLRAGLPPRRQDRPDPPAAAGIAEALLRAGEPEKAFELAAGIGLAGRRWFGWNEEFHGIDPPQQLLRIVSAMDRPTADQLDLVHDHVDAVEMPETRGTMLLALAHIAADAGETGRARDWLAAAADLVSDEPVPAGRMPMLALSMNSLGRQYVPDDPVVGRALALAALGDFDAAKPLLDGRAAALDAKDRARFRASVDLSLAGIALAQGDAARADAVLAALSAPQPAAQPAVDLSALDGGVRASAVPTSRQMASIARFHLALAAMEGGGSPAPWIDGAALVALPDYERVVFAREVILSACRRAIALPADMPDLVALLRVDDVLGFAALCRARNDALADRLAARLNALAALGLDEIDEGEERRDPRLRYLGDDWMIRLNAAIIGAEARERAIAPARRLRSLALVELAGVFAERGETALAAEATAGLEGSAWLPAARLRPAAVHLRRGDTAAGAALRAAAADAVAAARAVPVETLQPSARDALLLVLDAEARAAAGDADPDDALRPALRTLLDRASYGDSQFPAALADSVARRGAAAPGADMMAGETASMLDAFDAKRNPDILSARARLPGQTDALTAALFARLAKMEKDRRGEAGNPDGYLDDRTPNAFFFWLKPARMLARIQPP